MTVKKLTLSAPAKGVPYYTPEQDPPAGTGLSAKGGEIPTLFKPLTIRSMTLANRFMVSPMCMYSADDGHLTDWHLVHLGQYALHGAGLVCIEATAVLPNGRISPEDAGLWQDSQIAPMRRVADFVHSQNHKIAIQLAHAGRKASTRSPWHPPYQAASEQEGGWPENVWGPSAISFEDGVYADPTAMTLEQIELVGKSFVDAAKRAVEAGIDVIEIHAAHGYLMSEFLSPISNKRTDRYGGSFENRVRLPLEVAKAIRAVIPEGMPLFLRLSATEWMEYSGQESWTLEDSIRFAKLLPDAGVDLLDVSSGGNNNAQEIDLHPYYQIDLAGKIREAVKAEGKSLLIGAVGMVTGAEMAASIVQEGKGKPATNGTAVAANSADTVAVEDERGAITQADLVLVARQFMREPNFVINVAKNLGVEVRYPQQYHRM